MPKRVTAWYDRKWLVPTFAFLTSEPVNDFETPAIAIY